MAASPTYMAELIAKFREELIGKNLPMDQVNILVQMYAENLFEVTL